MQPETWEETHAEAEAAKRRDNIAQTARKAAAEKARAEAQLRTDLAAERAADASPQALLRCLWLLWGFVKDCVWLTGCGGRA